MNLKMKFSNKHINYLLENIKDTNTKKELIYIFNFLFKKLKCKIFLYI